MKKYKKTNSQNFGKIFFLKKKIFEKKKIFFETIKTIKTNFNYRTKVNIKRLSGRYRRTCNQTFWLATRIDHHGGDRLHDGALKHLADEL